MRSRFPIIDNHIHLDPKGHGVNAAQRFEKAGGTHLILVHKPYSSIHREDHEQQFGMTLKLAEEVRKKTDLVVFTALSPHPAEITALMKKHSLEEGKEILIKAIDLAAEHISVGRALAFGEAGRPHYPVNHDVLEAANELIEYTLEQAKELDCAVQFHTEGGEDSFRDIASMANKVGFPLEKCVKHFSGPEIFEYENYGLFPSVVARRSNMKKAITKGNRMLMETDYIDELARPNVVLPPETVPVLTLKYLAKGLFTDEDVHRIHSDNPERVYSIEMKLD